MMKKRLAGKSGLFVLGIIFLAFLVLAPSAYATGKGILGRSQYYYDRYCQYHRFFPFPCFFLGRVIELGNALTDLEDRQDAAGLKIAELEERVAALEAKPSSTPTSTPTPTPVSGALFINEFVASPDEEFENEWVEIYNPGPDDVDLAEPDGWTLVDAANHSKSLSDLGIIAPNSFAVLDADKGWLNDSGDTIYLKDPSGVVVDSYIYKSAKGDESIGRSIDGGGEWKTCETHSKGSSNDGSC